MMKRRDVTVKGFAVAQEKYTKTVSETKTCASFTHALLGISRSFQGSCPWNFPNFLAGVKMNLWRIGHDVKCTRLKPQCNVHSMTADEGKSFVSMKNVIGWFADISHWRNGAATSTSHVFFFSQISVTLRTISTSAPLCRYTPLSWLFSEILPGGLD